MLIHVIIQISYLKRLIVLMIKDKITQNFMTHSDMKNSCYTFFSLYFKALPQIISQSGEAEVQRRAVICASYP